jgi:hypothetical protein
LQNNTFFTHNQIVEARPRYLKVAY